MSFTSHNNSGVIFFFHYSIDHLRPKDILSFYFDTTQFENVGLTSSFKHFKSGQSTF